MRPLPTQTPIKVRSLLFDLDGTLLDTAPDLAATLNAVLTAQYRKTLPLDTIRPIISEGIVGLLNLGFHITEQDPQFLRLKKQFIDYYYHNTTKYSRLFSGVETLIHYLQKNKWPWGIVTNKPTIFTEKIMNQFTLLAQAQCIISGDTLRHKKPHPEPLLYACQCLDQLPEHCIYVGDAQRDIEAARSAGLFSIVALYGYIKDKKKVTAWKANAVIKTPTALINWLAGMKP